VVDAPTHLPSTEAFDSGAAANGTGHPVSGPVSRSWLPITEAHLPFTEHDRHREMVSLIVEA
jgi:hypothetical protein